MPRLPSVPGKGAPGSSSVSGVGGAFQSKREPEVPLQSALGASLNSSPHCRGGTAGGEGRRARPRKQTRVSSSPQDAAVALGVTGKVGWLAGVHARIRHRVEMRVGSAHPHRG